MGIATTTNSFQFRLTGIAGRSTTFRTRQNVKKRIADILYLRDLPEDVVRLYYVGTKELTPLTNLFIGDRSVELYANSRSTTIEEFIGNNAIGEIDVKNLNFLVTQEFVDAESGPIPLYYKHILPTSVIPKSVRVLDKDFNTISSDKYKLIAIQEFDDDTGSGTGVYSAYHLYNSLEGSYNHVTGEYNIYFVQYTDDLGVTEIVKTEILNNEPAYAEAGIDDYWSVTLELKPWARAYAISPDYKLTLPAPVAKFAIRYLEQKRISIKYPVDYTDIEPWYPRVVNGAFNHGYAGHTLRYSIQEFENQGFNPIEPYKLAAYKKCLKIDDRLVKLAHEDIETGLIFSSIDIVISENDITLYAITSDSDKDGEVYYNQDGDRVLDSNGDLITWSSSLFLGVDRLSGIVQVDVDLDDAYDIRGTYSYKETCFPVTGLIMNPIFDRNAHKEIRVIYIVPEGTVNGNVAIQTESVRWLRVSPSGVILATNQNSSGYNENINKVVKLVLATGTNISEGYRIEGVLGMHYSWEATAIVQAIGDYAEVLPGRDIPVNTTSSFPRTGWIRFLDNNGKYRYAKYESKDDLYFTLSDDLSECPVPTDPLFPEDILIPDGTTIELVNFLDERTTLTTRQSDDELAALPDVLDYPVSFSQYFILGEMTINSPHAVQDATVIDVRQDGGGIRDDRYEDAKRLNPQVQWFNDINTFDGQVYPGNAVNVIKLPISLLERYSLDNIREIVEDSVPMGVHALIRFYGYEPRVVSVTPEEESVRIKWEKEGPEFVYNIWQANNESGPWNKVHDYRIVDGSGDLNEFLVEGLTHNKIYIYRITMQDKYFLWWYGYTSHSSIDGGLGLDEDPPTPPFGNLVNFQFEIV